MGFGASNFVLPDAKHRASIVSVALSLGFEPDREKFLSRVVLMPGCR